MFLFKRRNRKRPSLTVRTMILVHRWLSPLVRRPGVTMATGFLLLITGLAEAAEILFPHIETELDSAHGVAIFGIVTVLRGFIEMVEGLEIMGLEAEVRPPDEGKPG